MEFDRDESVPQGVGRLVDENGLLYREAPNGYVYLGDVSRNLMGKQGQYGTRYAGGDEYYPNLAEGLRYKGFLINTTKQCIQTT